MNYNTLCLELFDSVATVWFNRPEKRNALNRELLEELIGALDQLSASAEVGVLVLRGKGKVFSAGADLEFMQDTGDRTLPELKEEAALFYDCFSRLQQFPRPVISYAHGAVHGGANGMVASADFAYCDGATIFSFSEVKLGLVPAAVSPFIIPRTGMVRARQLMLSGEILNGPAAVAAGICDRVVGVEDAEVFLNDLAASILQNAPNAVSATKKMFNDLRKAETDERELTTELISRIRQSDEAREGIRSFFEKRKPKWTKDP